MMSFGMISLVVVAALLLMGLGHRVLDRLRLTDKSALLIIVSIAISTIFIPNINLTNRISVNVGGFLIPMGLAIYLFVKAGTGKEKTRSIVASIIVGIAIYILQRYVLPSEPETLMIEPNYVYPVVGAIVAYLMGRSRRASFIAGVVGVVISDLIHLIISVINNIPSPTRFGGAGGVDSTVLTGIFAVVIAEVVGEIREKMQGGTDKKDHWFEDGEFVSPDSLKEEEKKNNLDEVRGEKDED